MSAWPAPIFTTGWLESRVVFAEDDILLREGLASLLERCSTGGVADAPSSRSREGSATFTNADVDQAHERGDYACAA
jgi:hypothetical protein